MCTPTESYPQPRGGTYPLPPRWPLPPSVLPCPTRCPGPHVPRFRVPPQEQSQDVLPALWTMTASPAGPEGQPPAMVSRKPLRCSVAAQCFGAWVQGLPPCLSFEVCVSRAFLFHLHCQSLLTGFSSHPSHPFTVVASSFSSQVYNLRHYAVTSLTPDCIPGSRICFSY